MEVLLRLDHLQIPEDDSSTMNALPPVINSILHLPELAGPSPPDEVIGRLVREPGFRRDLLEEATKTVSAFTYRPDVSPEGFSLHPSGVMHPLTPFQCHAWGCRRRSVRGFAQVAALYSDTTVLTDVLGGRLLAKAQSNDPWHETEIERLASDIATVLEIQPLIRSGAIQFSSPGHAICPVHDRPTFEILSDVAQQGLEFLLNDMRLRVLEEKVYIDSSIFGKDIGLGPLSIDSRRRQAFKGLKSKNAIRRWVVKNFGPILSREIVSRATSALIDCRNAAESGATIAAAAPIEIMASKAVFNRSPQPDLSMDASAAARLRLPWIPDLTASELVDLRERASSALPNFRLQIARSLRSGTSSDLNEIATSLQDSVPDLDAELRAALAKRTGGAGPSAILLGLGMVLCGIASANPLVAAAGAPLVAGGCSLWSTDKVAVSELELARSKPAYVLLAARELLRERH